MMLTDFVFSETLKCKSLFRQTFNSANPSTVSESTCGGSWRPSACPTSSIIQTSAVRSLRSRDRLQWQSKINMPACGPTPRDPRDRLVEARGVLMAFNLATAISRNTTMTTKSSYSSKRSAPATRRRPRSLQERVQLIICGLTTQKSLRLTTQVGSISLMAALANAQLQIVTT